MNLLLRRALCVVGLIAVSADIAQGQQFAYRVSFTDKQGSPAISNPLSFLSQRALDRRTKLNVAIDTTDVPVSPAYIDSALTISGGKLHTTSRWMNNCVVLVNDSNDIKPLQSRPYVSAIEYVGYFPGGLHKRSAPQGENNTTGTPQPAGTQAYYGGAWAQTEMVNGDYLHDKGYKGQGMLIAVMDDGFRYVDVNPAFDSMRNNGRLLETRDFVLAANNVYDYSSHGTSSLSTMAGYVPATYVGSAPEASYALYRTEDNTSEQPIELDNLIAAAERADSLGVDVISVSLGYNSFSGPAGNESFTYADIDGKSTIVARAANMATAKGILWVNSAGNEGAGPWKYILTPADADSVLTIGSVGANQLPPINSGYGPNAAGHVKPNVCAMGQPAAVLSSGVNPLNVNGTSFAAPQISGWAACLWQVNPNATPFMLRDAIERSAHLYPNFGPQLGYGIPDFEKAFTTLEIPDTPENSTEWLSTYPNPFTEDLEILIRSNGQGKASVALYDVAGRAIVNNQVNLPHGWSSHQINTPQSIPGGIYFLKVISGDNMRVIKLVKN